MGYLINVHSGHLTYLKSVHVFGRNSRNIDTQLIGWHVSRLQFILKFSGDTWTIEDVSKNGTYINGSRLFKSQKTLSVGDLIGLTNDKENTWELKDVNPPLPFLIDQNTGEFIELSDVNLLPNEEDSDFCIFRAEGEWKIDKDNHTANIESGDIVFSQGRSWRFFPNDLGLDTVTQDLHTKNNSPKKTIVFYVSLNEENVRIIIKDAFSEVDLGYRSHHDILLRLARQRLVDKGCGIPLCEQGWLTTEVLLLELRISESHLNTLIYRCRKSMIKCRCQSIQIERRSGELRLSQCRFTLHKGDEHTLYL